jgi:hypothetical protein
VMCENISSQSRAHFISPLSSPGAPEHIFPMLVRDLPSEASLDHPFPMIAWCPSWQGHMASSTWLGLLSCLTSLHLS